MSHREMHTHRDVRQRETRGCQHRNVARLESGGRLPECVLESDDVEVAMVTSGRGEERRDGGAQKLLGHEPASKKRGYNVIVLALFVWLCV